MYPYIEKEPNLVLIEAVKDLKEGLKVLEPIIVYEKEGIYIEKKLKFKENSARKTLILLQKPIYLIFYIHYI